MIKEATINLASLIISYGFFDHIFAVREPCFDMNGPARPE